MAAKLGSDDEVIADINVTPFVDIVLVLLIILMVTSTQIVRAAIQVDLPKAASGGELVPSTLNLVLDAKGVLYIDGQVATEDELVAAVKAEKKESTDLQAVIAADQTVPYGRVVRLIDLIKSNGVTAFALNIERTAEGS